MNEQTRDVNNMHTERQIFTCGFFEAARLFHGGLTFEQIKMQVISETSSAFMLGVLAGVDALSGWLDSAERTARAYMNREDATRLVLSVQGDKCCTLVMNARTKKRGLK